MDNFEISQARLTLASGDCPPERRAGLEGIVTAVGVQETDDVVLGYLADGTPITPATAGGDPGFLSRPGLVLNEAGRAVKRHMEELASTDPFLRAKALGIDLEAVRATAVRMRKPFLQVLMAELDFRDQTAAAYAHPAVRGL